MNLFGSISFTLCTAVWIFNYLINPDPGYALLSCLSLIAAAYYWVCFLEERSNAKD